MNRDNGRFPYRMREPRSRGVTLVELVVSMAITSMLMVGVVSAVLLATHALPDGDSPAETAFEAAAAADQILGEVQYALNFTERTATAVTFTVADRNGDLVDETIRYAWSGTAGDPLTRQYNGGNIGTIVDDVQAFDLAYPVRTVTETQQQETTTDSGEVLLATWDGWTGINPAPDPKVTLTSEYFVANIPNDATRLTIIRAVVKMRQLAGGTGNITVAIHQAAGSSGPEPAANPIGTPVSMPSSTLPPSTGPFEWTPFVFTDVVIDSPPTGYCIVTDDTTQNAGEVLFYNDRNAPADVPVGLWSTDGGASWLPAQANKRNQNDMPFFVYGSYTATSMQDVEVSRYFVIGVNVTIRVGPDALSHVDSGVSILSEPEVSSP